MHSRRTFLLKLLPAAGVALMVAPKALAQAEKASETDPTATSLGYKADGSKVDKQKFPKYAADQSCSNCALYQGKATDAWAPCPALSNKLVSGKGWCSVWAKRAG